ncbi:MAG TPA: aldehyde dehydrogenase [Spirochaetota bacterium]|nr:aldehyde dehydrogenase [Spirochaetota bacterium]
MKSIKSVMENLEKYYRSGATIPVDFRIKTLRDLYNNIKENQNAIIRALSRDLHKPAFETYATEIGIVLDEIRKTCSHLKKWARPKRVSTPMHQFYASSYIIKEPYGTVLIISPWNYPFQLAISPLIGAVAAGNTVMIKPSEISPNTSKIMASIITKSFDSGHVSVVQGDVKTSTEILKQKFDYIFFTGSTVVGRVVMKAAAENLTPVTLELGGKSPALVYKDANLSLAAKRIVWGKFMNAGQTCVAPDYCFIHSEIKEQFTEELCRVIKEFYGDDPSKSPFYARMINQSHYTRVKSYIKQGKVICGGSSNDKSRYIEPTIIEGASPKSAVMCDEIFGPILPVMFYDDISTALEFINARPKPLALYIFSASRGFQKHVLNETRAGGVTINDTVVHLVNPKLPFGGVGHSGMGSYHGKYSFDTFSADKPVMIRSTKIDIPFRYPPYSKLKAALIKMFLH